MLHPKRKMSQPNFFTAGSPFLQHPLLTAVRTTQEIDFVLEMVTPPAGGRILDVGCGFGRHSIELAQRGFAVTAIDPSAAMIAAARQRADEVDVDITFQQVAAESFVGEDKFDLALCLFTTLGQVSETGENSQLIERVYAALRPNGAFVVEVPQRETAVRQLKPSDQFGSTAVTRQFDVDNNVVTERFVVGETAEFLLQYRLFSREELVGLVERVGFEITAVYEDCAGNVLTDDSDNMLFFLERP